MPFGDIFRKRRDEAPFLILLAFLISFAFARLWVLLQVGDPVPGTERYIIHHLYYGVALLIVAGWLAINYRDERIFHVTALIYGAGLGIFFDEIGLLLTHFGNYWDVITYTFVVIIILILLNIIFFKDFWRAVSSDVKSYAEEKKLKYGPLNLMGAISFLERVDKKMPRTGKITRVFTGVVLMAAGIMVLEYPSLIKYWVAAAFFLSGAAYVIGSLKE